MKADMSILVDVPERKHFQDFGERGAFNRWMRYAIVFAVLFCAAALLMVFLMDSKRAPAEKGAQKEKVVEKLPVVADLPGKSKTSSTTGTSTTKSTKSGSTTTKKPPVRKTTKTN
jgi:preprotein translocase subunit SecG